jgi:hypothetical protein
LRSFGALVDDTFTYGQARQAGVGGKVIYRLRDTLESRPLSPSAMFHGTTTTQPPFQTSATVLAAPSMPRLRILIPSCEGITSAGKKDLVSKSMVRQHFRI